MKVTRQTKLIGAGGLGLVLLVLVVKMVVLKPPATDATPIPVVVHHALHAPPKTQPRRHATATPHRAAPKLDATLPAALRRELALHQVVVAVLYAPDMPGESSAVAVARSAAKATHAGFAALDVRNESIAQTMALKAKDALDPSVLVVTRPGTIAFILSPYAGADALAQAVVSAR